MILPSRKFTPAFHAHLKSITQKIANAFHITGPFNMQYIVERDGTVRVIECNIRASRSFPFVSKVLGVNFIDAATRVMCNVNVAPRDLMLEFQDASFQAVKVPQFSWTRLAGADPRLGVEMASTGEVAAFGEDAYEAYWIAMMSANNFVPPPTGSGILVGVDVASDAENFQTVVTMLHQDGFKVYVPELFDSTSPQSENTTTSHPPLSLPSFIKRIPMHGNVKEIRALWAAKSISMVMSLAGERSKGKHALNYLMRRFAVDFGIPLINNEKGALMFLKSLRRVDGGGGLGRRHGVRSWDEMTSRRSQDSS